MGTKDLRTIEAAADESWEPAMAELNPKQRAFVLGYVCQTNADATAAARLAGYESNGSDQSIRVTGFRLTHDPKVLAAIREIVVSRASKNLLVCELPGES